MKFYQNLDFSKIFTPVLLLNFVTLLIEHVINIRFYLFRLNRVRWVEEQSYAEKLSKEIHLRIAKIFDFTAALRIIAQFTLLKLWCEILQKHFYS